MRSASLLCMSDAAGSPSSAASIRRPAVVSDRPSPGSASASASASTSTSVSEVAAYYRDVAPFYDAELADRDDLPFWQRIGRRFAGASVLELGCGSGTVTEVLAADARRLVGVDLSDDLLQHARRRLTRWPHVALTRADMRELPLSASAGQFDLIVAANDPFSHLTTAEDRDAVLHSVAHLLSPGGQLILDALWLPPADARAVATPAGRVQQHAATLRGQPLRVVERWRRDPARRSCCLARYEYQVSGRQPVVASFQARDWTVSELAQRLERAGLAEVARWGGYDSRPWDPNTSQHLIVAAHVPR
ncbi:MAG: class I SAM-dependent methyltransferase [Chloroflexi bacterium]|nr:class I SAM-dependent methyltransferase [Chloroflexota bacterium]